jgi:hypothetical protein
MQKEVIDDVVEDMRNDIHREVLKPQWLSADDGERRGPHPFRVLLMAMKMGIYKLEVELYVQYLFRIPIFDYSL